MENRTHVERLFRILTQSIGDIADAVGASYDAVRSWSVGRRSPSHEHLDQLAELAERHGQNLSGLAEDLREEASRKRAEKEE